MNRRGIGTEAIRAVTVMAAGAVAGLAVSQVVVGLLLGCAAYLTLHIVCVVRLGAAVARGGNVEGACQSGLWQPVFAGVQRLQDRSRKRKRRLARFLRRFREAAHAMPDAVMVLRRDGSVEWCNPAAERLLGVVCTASTASQGRNIIEVVPEPLLAEYLNADDFDTPLTIPSPVNNACVLSLRIRRFARKRQLLVVASDVTRVHHLDQARRDFVANASHELRTPLTVVNGFLEMLAELEDWHAPEVARSLHLMRQQTARMQNIVGDMLTLSRLEMAPARAPRSPVCVPTLLDAIVDEARALSGDERHVIAVEASPRLCLLGSEDELRSAFSNLVFNAVLHTPAGTRIRVLWKRSGESAVFAVSDTGEGIEAKHIPRLTERFYRVDGGRARKGGGTGLGLAIVKHVLDRHGADLVIRSVKGKGTVFTCRFPALRTLRGDTDNAVHEGTAPRAATGG